MKSDMWAIAGHFGDSRIKTVTFSSPGCQLHLKRKEVGTEFLVKSY